MCYSCTGCSLNVIIYCDSVSVTLFLLIDPSGELTGILWSPIDCAISGGVHPLHVQWRVMVIEWAVDGKEGHWPKQQHGGGRGVGCVCVWGAAVATLTFTVPPHQLINLIGQTSNHGDLHLWPPPHYCHAWLFIAWGLEMGPVLVRSRTIH